MKKRRFFNLVEILLAMGVTAIGIAGLCAVLPVGLIAARDAYQSSCVCGIMTEIYDRINHWCGLYFDQVISEEYNDSYHQGVPVTSGYEDMGYYYKEANGEVVTNTFDFAEQRRWCWPYMRKEKDPTIPFTDDAHTVPWNSADIWRFSGELNITGAGEKTADNSKLNKNDTFACIPGLWRFRVFSDFAGEYRIWKEIPADIGAFNNAEKKRLVRVYIEFSYPSQAAYKNRTKRLFAREFYEWRAAWYPKN